MKWLIKIPAILSILFFAHVPAFAKDAALIVTKNSKIAAVQSAVLTKAFNLPQVKLPTGEPIVLVVKAANLTETQIVASKLLGKSSSDFDAAIAKKHVIVVGTDAEVINLVGSLPNAIGVVDVYSITRAITVLKVDGKLPLEPGYLLHYN